MIKSFYGDKVDPTILLTRMKNGLANEMIKKYEDIPDQDKPSIMGERIKKMSLDKFFNFVEKRVNLSGQRIRRKILKLYSLK